ncbi:MAG: SDR family oxidoreductase [bacterium]|nr:SDR family oxidoreductase [bacterium]
MAKYLITGGAGFIGSNIARELVKKKHKVIILDNLFSGRLSNLEDIKDKVEFINGDIRNFETVKKAVTGVDYVLHQAALRGVYQSVKDPQAVNETNITGTLNLLVASRDAKVKRFVFASSSSVYGLIGNKKNIETLPPKPESPYALTKLTGEEYCRLFYKIFGLKTISLRYFNVFGPYQNPDDSYAAVIPIFVKNALNDRPSEIHGTGKQSRDFTYIANVVQANIKASTSPKAIFGEVYNIAAGQNTSIQQLHNQIQKDLKKNIKPTQKPQRQGDTPRSFADISKANKYLNYAPKINFESGLKKTLLWYKNNI